MMHSFSDCVFHIEMHAKIRPQISMQDICILSEMLGGDTSVGNCQLPIHVITEAEWGKASHSGTPIYGFNWKCPKVTQA